MAVSTVAGKEGSVINFNAVSINHSDTNTHKRRRRRRRRTGGGGRTRGIEREGSNRNERCPSQGANRGV